MRREIVPVSPRDPSIYRAFLSMCQPWGFGAMWSDATTPRTDKPVRFCYLSNAPQSRPCIARGYMGYAQPVRFA